MFYYDHSKRKGSRPAQLQPSALVSVNAQIRKYFERSEAARLQMDVPTVWKVTLSAEVVDALRKLSHDKCPFCERQGVPLQPYRFRPPAYADPPNAPADRSCYLWLSFHWENLFPICADCLPSKKSLFPVSGPRAAYPIDRSMAAIENGPGIDLGEAAELIYPGELENPAEVFDVTMDGVLIGNDERARATIQNYSLNRPQLVQARRTAFLDFIDDLLRARPFSSRAKDPFVNLPFGGALALLLRKILGEFDQSESARGRLAVEPVQDLARDWSRRADFATGIESAVTTLRAGEEVAPLPQPDEASPPAAPRKVLNRLEEISIRSFRSLDNLTLVVPPLTTADVTPPPSITGARWRPSTPCLLILGENAAGKSSVLEAVALASLSQKEVDKLSLDKTTIPLKPLVYGIPGDGAASRGDGLPQILRRQSAVCSRPSLAGQNSGDQHRRSKGARSIRLRSAQALRCGGTDGDHSSCRHAVSSSATRFQPRALADQPVRRSKGRPGGSRKCTALRDRD